MNSLIVLALIAAGDIPRAPEDRPRAPISEPTTARQTGPVEKSAPPVGDKFRPRFPRLLFFHASWCQPCRDALDGPNGFRKWLEAAGWSIGHSYRDHVQLIDVDAAPDDARIRKILESVDMIPALVLLAEDSSSNPIVYNGRDSITKLLQNEKTGSGDADAVPTPYSEVVRVIGLMPKPEVGFVDFGCGDARWCIVAAERWGCRVTGIEIDPGRAEAARKRVQEAGLDHLITIVEGDALTTDVNADVGVAYLFQEVLDKLKPKIEKLRFFASYMHRPAGLPMVKNGDSWVYARASYSAAPSARVAQPRAAVWGGQLYYRPVCDNPRCGMCNSIRAQLGQ